MGSEFFRCIFRIVKKETLEKMRYILEVWRVWCFWDGEYFEWIYIDFYNLQKLFQVFETLNFITFEIILD